MRGKRYGTMPKSLVADELRDYADELHPSVEYHVYLCLHDIADRIDEEHERRMRQVRGSYRGHIKKRAREYATKREREVERELEAEHALVVTLEQSDEQLRAENAKLRELIADTLMQPRDYCKKYGIEYESWDSVNDHLDARMRELGIEAGDGVS